MPEHRGTERPIKGQKRRRAGERERGLAERDKKKWQKQRKKELRKKKTAVEGGKCAKGEADKIGQKIRAIVSFWVIYSYLPTTWVLSY